MCRSADALLVVGSSIMTMSALRLVRYVHQILGCLFLRALGSNITGSSIHVSLRLEAPCSSKQAEHMKNLGTTAEIFMKRGTRLVLWSCPLDQTILCLSHSVQVFVSSCVSVDSYSTICRVLWQCLISSSYRHLWILMCQGGCGYGLTHSYFEYRSYSGWWSRFSENRKTLWRGQYRFPSTEKPSIVVVQCLFESSHLLT